MQEQEIGEVVNIKKVLLEKVHLKDTRRFAQ